MKNGSSLRRAEFWSSVECALFLRGLTGALESHGWSGQERFEISEKNYRGARGSLARLGMRWRTYLNYPWTLRKSLRASERPDVAVVCTNTFYAPRIAEMVSKKTPVIHWVFDLFPDVLLVGGNLRTGSLRAKWLDGLARKTFERAAVNVFLGEHLLSHAVKRFGAVPRAVVIPIGCDARPFSEAPPKTREKGEPVRMLYCGNLGRMHDVDTIANVLRRGIPLTLEVCFRGNGHGFVLLEKELREARNASGVEIGASLKEADWISEMRCADVALVTMKPGAEGVVMPSKAYSALAAGQAVVAICPENSDLAATIHRHDCGWVIAPGDVEQLSSVLNEIVSNPAELFRRRTNAWQAGQHVFDQRVLARQWSEVLSRAVSGFSQS